MLDPLCMQIYLICASSGCYPACFPSSALVLHHERFLVFDTHLKLNDVCMYQSANGLLESRLNRRPWKWRTSFMLRIDSMELVRAVIDMVLRAPAIYREVGK